MVRLCQLDPGLTEARSSTNTVFWPLSTISLLHWIIAVQVQVPTAPSPVLAAFPTFQCGGHWPLVPASSGEY